MAHTSTSVRRIAGSALGGALLAGALGACVIGGQPLTPARFDILEDDSTLVIGTDTDVTYTVEALSPFPAPVEYSVEGDAALFTVTDDCIGQFTAGSTCTITITIDGSTVAGSLTLTVPGDSVAIDIEEAP